MPTLPSVSLSLCLCFGGVTCCQWGGGWTVAVERCEIQALVNEQRSSAKSLGSPHLIITSLFLSNLCLHLASTYLSLSVSVFLFLSSFSSYLFTLLSVSLHQVFLSSASALCAAIFLHHAWLSHSHVLSFLFLLPLFILFSTFAACGTRKTTQSPGTSLIQPTSTR